MDKAGVTSRIKSILRWQGRSLVQLGLLYPALMLGLFFVVPLGMTLAVSVANRSTSGFYELGFNLSHYGRFATPLFLRQTLFSVMLAGGAAVGCVSVAFPFTYLLSQLAHPVQVAILVFLLAVLSLSEVVIGFSWSVLLSERAGLSNLLVWLGLLPQAVAWSPSLVAVLLALIYRAFPFAVLLIYPAVSRLNPEIAEAAQTLGASPTRTFWDIVVPMLRPSWITALILVFIFALGSYLMPQMLGRPQHWTLSVLITDQAIALSNLPLASALALILMMLTLLLVWLTIAASKLTGVKS